MDRVHVTFNDDELVANAGLLQPATLVECLGLDALINNIVRHDGRVGGASPGRKVLTLMNTMLASGSTSTMPTCWRLHADPDGSAKSAQERFESRKLHLSELLTPGVKRNRPKLIATINVTDLIAAKLGGILDTNTGPITLSVEAIRRMACDAGTHRLITGPDGVIIDYGRQTRSVSDAQFDLLTIRHHGCRIPGCPIPPGGCDAHHSIHWANDGNTDLDDRPTTARRRRRMTSTRVRAWRQPRSGRFGASRSASR